MGQSVPRSANAALQSSRVRKLVIVSVLRRGHRDIDQAYERSSIFPSGR